MRHKPQVLPGVPLNEAVVLIAERVKWLCPLPLVVTCSEESRFFIIQVFIVSRSLGKVMIVVFVPQAVGNGSDAPVIKCLLQCDGNRRSLPVAGHVAQFFPQVKRRVGVRPCAALDHRSIGFLNIDAGQVGENGVGDDRDGMVAYHAVVLLSPQVPDGQVAIGVVMAHHVVHKLCRQVGFEQEVKRMRGAEGVPQRECGVVTLTLGHLAYLVVGVHVSAIDIAHGVGLQQHMVESGVEDLLLFLSAVNIDA